MFWIIESNIKINHTELNLLYTILLLVCGSWHFSPSVIYVYCYLLGYIGSQSYVFLSGTPIPPDHFFVTNIPFYQAWQQLY
jgi:hypothetical protein